MRTILTFLPLVASVAFYAVVLGAFLVAWRRHRRRSASTGARETPRVSILKPVAGVDDELRDNLESFAAIDYPGFELLIGIADPDDPALPVVRAFAAAHPELAVRVVRTDPRAAENPKVAQLHGLEAAASGEVLVISDANVRVSPGYLRGLVAALGEPGVGLVSSVVAGTGDRTWGAALENLQLGGFIAPGVVASSILARRPLTIGKSMAFRRVDLARLGGFAIVADVLAEDHVLGRVFHEAGLGVRVVLEPVENRNVACSFARTIERHTRWAKMRRAIVPATFLVEPLFSPIVVAAATFVLAPSDASLALLVACTALQTLGAAVAMRIVRGAMPRARHVVLEPLRALVVQLCWMRALVSRRIEWRGHPFLLAEDSRLVPAPPSRLRALLAGAPLSLRP